MHIINESERVYRHEFTLSFSSVETPGWGYSFPCDEAGNIQSLNPTASANLAYAIAHPELFIPNGVEKREWSYFQPAIGKCSCGREVDLAHFTNTCNCGADYNMSGQRLAPRQFWGEETGEQPSDCI